MSILLKQIGYQLKDPSLLDNRSFIGGEWREASDGRTFTVYDPEDNQEICKVADLSRIDVAKAIDIAHDAFKVYKKVPPRQRRFLLRKWADLIKANRDDLAAICTLELGKPFTESIVTVNYGIDFLDWFEGEVERQYGDTIAAARGNNRIFTTKEPQGVVAAITPWNSPIAMITRKVGAAIAAGNTVLCKPAPETPLCAIALAKLFERAGYPPGVLNIITCSSENTPEVGRELCVNRLVRHLSFTGSTAVGKLLNAECAKTLKKTSMELGGNAPFIVFEDANITDAVSGLISSKFRSSGQTCVCANRVLVHETILPDFVEALKLRAEKEFSYGSVWDKKVNFGPLYSPKALQKVQRHIADAKSHGATLVLGGDIDQSRGPNFFPPTILQGGTASMQCAQEETFGPLAVIISFCSEEEAIHIANDTETGLAGYFYTQDIARLWRVSEALEVGMVGCRVGLISACEQPFGGIKESGLGREGSKHALEEYLNVKSVTVGL